LTHSGQQVAAGLVFDGYRDNVAIENVRLQFVAHRGEQAWIITGVESVAAPFEAFAPAGDYPADGAGSL
jgi:hypothetical protein